MECLNLSIYIYYIYIEHVIMKYTVHLLYLDLLKLLLERSNNGLGRLLMHLDMMVNVPNYVDLSSFTRWIFSPEAEIWCLIQHQLVQLVDIWLPLILKQNKIIYLGHRTRAPMLPEHDPGRPLSTR